MAPYTIAKIRNLAAPVLKKFRVVKAGVFGSAASGKMKQGSDIDLLVKLSGSSDLFDFVELKLELEKTLGKKVDLVEYSAIKPALKNAILGSEVKLL